MHREQTIRNIATTILAVLIVAAIIFGSKIYLLFHGHTQVSSTFEIFGLTGHVYGLIVFISVLVGYWVARRLAILENINLDNYLINIFTGFVWALVGARVVFAIFRPDVFDSIWQVLEIWRGGLSIHGALIGIVLYLWYLAPRMKVAYPKLLDIFAPGIALGQVIGRWGNFINQEAYGGPTSLPWKMFVDKPHRFADLVDHKYYHPAFLYESLGMLLVFLILLYIYARNKHAGTVAVGYLLLYSVLRFVVEFFRIDKVLWGPLSAAQWASLALVVSVGLWLLARPKIAKA
jgi:phosphatidylglycerol:prolipoprotein diacylglycerol transferase